VTSHSDSDSDSETDAGSDVDVDTTTQAETFNALAGWVWNDGTQATSNHSHCGNGDRFLHASLPSDGLSISKRFHHLPQHSEISLQARVHFIDAWRGAQVYAKIDGEFVWLDAHDNSEHRESVLKSATGTASPVIPGTVDADTLPLHEGGINLCGGDHTGDRLSVPIKVYVPHARDSVTVTFGSTSLSEGSSFGIDDVSIYVR